MQAVDPAPKTSRKEISCEFCTAGTTQQPCSRCSAAFNCGFITRVYRTIAVLMLYQELLGKVGPSKENGSAAFVSSEVIFFITESEDHMSHEVYRIKRSHPKFDEIRAYNQACAGRTYTNELVDAEDNAKLTKWAHCRSETRTLGLLMTDYPYGDVFAMPEINSQKTQEEQYCCQFEFEECPRINSMLSAFAAYHPLWCILFTLPTLTLVPSQTTVAAAWTLRREFCNCWDSMFSNMGIQNFPPCLFRGNQKLMLTTSFHDLVTDRNAQKNRQMFTELLEDVTKATKNDGSEVQHLLEYYQQAKLTDEKEKNLVDALIAYLQSVLIVDTPERRQFAADCYVEYERTRSVTCMPNLCLIPKITPADVQELRMGLKDYKFRLLARDVIPTTIPTATDAAPIHYFKWKDFDEAWVLNSVEFYANAVLLAAISKKKKTIDANTVWGGFVEGKGYVIAIRWQ